MNAKAKRNKKGYIVTALMLILVMTVLLAACTKAKDNGNKPTPEIDKDKIVSVDNGSNTANEPASPTKEPEAASQTSETKADEDKKASELKPSKKPAEPEPTSNEPDVNNPENIEVKLLYGYEYKWDDELNTSLGYFRYQTAGLTYSDGKRYPELKDALDSFFEVSDEDIDEKLTTIADAARGDEAYDDTYFNNTMIMPLRADSNLVSCSYSYEEYTGGVHGIYGTLGFSFDPASGKRFAVSELLKDREAFVDYLYNELLQKEDDLLYDSADTLKDTLNKNLDEDSLAVIFGYDHATVIINPYDMFPYASGQTCIDIPYKNHEGMFDDKVLYAADNYMYPIDDWYSIREDFGDDGVVDTLRIYKNYCNEYEDFDSLTLYLNDEPVPKSFKVEEYCYGLEPYFVHVDGRDFLYVNVWFASEDCWSYVYEIVMNGSSGGDVIESEISLGSFFNESAAYDPKYAELSFRFDVIGTNEISASYELSADKDPKMLSDEYYFKYGSVTTAKEITMTVVDEGGDLKEGDSVTLKPGMELSLFSTDGVSYIDFIVESFDFAILRMPITRTDEEYYCTFSMEDGSAFYEWFDGILYAD